MLENQNASKNVACTLLRSMGSTLRTKARPLGRSDSIPVEEGNTLCARALVLMILCSCKGIFWALEQPSTSTMEWHPCFQALLKLITVRRLRFRMSCFGGPTPKPTILYSSNLRDDIFSDFVSGFTSKFTIKTVCIFVGCFPGSRVDLQIQTQSSLYFWLFLRICK